MSTLQEILPAILLASRDAAILALVVGAVLLLFLRRLPPVWRHGLWMLVVVPALPEKRVFMAALAGSGGGEKGLWRDDPLPRGSRPLRSSPFSWSSGGKDGDRRAVHS